MKYKNLILTFLIIVISILTFLVYDGFKKYMGEIGNIVEEEIITEPENKDVGQVLYVTNFEEVKSYLNRNSTSILVLGKTGCRFCEMYIPVLDSVSKKNNVEFIYVNLTNLDDENYNFIMNSDLLIPAKCNNYGENIPLKKGFGTPLSLFIKSGEVYDCIRGYKDEHALINLLSEITLY